MQEDDLPQDSFVQSPENVIGSAIPDTQGDPEDNFIDLWDEQEEYEIEKIIHGKYKKDGLVYLVKWKGFSKDHNSYVKFEDMNEFCRKFVDENPIKMIGRPKNKTK